MAGRARHALAGVCGLAVVCGVAVDARAAPHVWTNDDAMGRSQPITRLLQYEGSNQRQSVRVEGRVMRVVVHPSQPNLLIQRNAGAAFLQGASEGMSLGFLPGSLDEAAYRRAAEAVALPAGCRITDLRPLDGKVSWEATYVCPPGVGLRPSGRRPGP
jgi:hypothetical protein